MIILRIILLYGWINCIYFGYYFIKENQTFDDFISFLRQTYSFDWTKSLGMFGGFITVGIGLLTMFIMGWSFLFILKLIWVWLIEDEVKKDDFE